MAFLNHGQGISWLCVTRPSNLQSGGMLRGKMMEIGKSRKGRQGPGICKHGMLSNAFVAACTPCDLIDVSWPFYAEIPPSFSHSLQEILLFSPFRQKESAPYGKWVNLILAYWLKDWLIDPCWGPFQRRESDGTSRPETPRKAERFEKQSSPVYEPSFCDSLSFPR